MNQDAKALEDALAKVEHCGKFSKASRGTVETEETDEWPRVTVSVHANKIVGPKLAAYIAACSPARLRRILDALAEAERRAEAAEADARRYAWLREQHESSDSAESFCVFEPTPAHDLYPVGSMPGELDEAIDAHLSKEPSNGR